MRKGEWLALGAAIALTLLLCADWFFLSTPDARVGAHESGWRSLGWPREVRDASSTSGSSSRPCELTVSGSRSS